MTGLLYKDFFILWHAYKKNLALVAVLYGLMAVAMELGFMLFMLCWVMGFYVIGSISIDNTSKWDLYAATLPVSSGQIVGAKFLLTALALLGGCVYGALVSLLLWLLHGTPLNESLVSVLIVALVCLAYFGITLVLAYRFGVEKARTSMLLAVAALGAAVMAAFRLGWLDSGALMALEMDPLYAAAGLAAVCAAVYLACWGCSVAIYSKKEF